MDYGVGGLPDVADPELFKKPNAGDDSLFVVFYMGVIRNDARSHDEGRPIFDDRECVRIIVPGDKNNIIDRPCEPSDRQRFAKQYALFKQGVKEDEQVSGTRLTDWPFLSRAQSEEFKYLGIRTVEQLAEVRDDIVGRVPGLTTLKQTAQAWLARSKDTAAAAKMAKLMSDQKSELEQLREVIKRQGEQIDKLQGVPTKA